jgi:hypothetical protein
MTAIVSIDHNPPTALVDTQTPLAKRGFLPWIVLALCVVLFIYGDSTIPRAGISQWGLLAVASPAYGLSILMAAAGFVIAVRRANFKAAVVATLLMITTQRLPTSIATDMPMFAWTYKHIGVTDYIHHAHALARGVDIYNGWPGLFAVTAWFSDVTGLSVVTIAHWFTPLFYLAFIPVVYGAARAWGLKPLEGVTAAFLVATLNWVAQDYFSPQAIAITRSSHWDLANRRAIRRYHDYPPTYSVLATACDGLTCGQPKDEAMVDPAAVSGNGDRTIGVQLG